MIVVNDVLIQQFDDYFERVSVHPHAYEEIAHVFSSNVSPDATAWGKRLVPSPPRSVQQRSAVSLKRIAALLLTVNSHISSQNTDTGGHMSKAWQVQEAKARFSEFLEASVREGPQIVTKRGVEAAVLLSIEQWRGLRNVSTTLRHFGE